MYVVVAYKVDFVYVLLKRGKRFDYFTSCLPWTQKATAVSLPLGTSAPVLGIGTFDQNFGDSNQTAYESDNTSSVYTYSHVINPSAAQTKVLIEGSAATSGYPMIRADLSNATAATINSLRSAIQLQAFYERDARGGTRYVELVKSHFNVNDPEGLIQIRPQYLGGNSESVNIHPIAQTSDTLS